jgi:hypothetical protein
MSQYKGKNASDESSYKDSDNEGERKRGTSKEAMWGHDDQFHEMCREKDREIKRLKVELRLLKLQGRNTKQKMRLDFQWDGEDANLANKVSDWVKTCLFPRYKF